MKLVKIRGYGNSPGIVFLNPLKGYKEVALLKWCSFKNRTDMLPKTPKRKPALIKEADLNIHLKKIDLPSDALTSKTSKEVFEYKLLDDTETLESENTNTQAPRNYGVYEIHCNIAESSYHNKRTNNFGDYTDCDDEIIFVGLAWDKVESLNWFPIKEHLVSANSGIKNISIEIKEVCEPRNTCENEKQIHYIYIVLR